MAKIRKVCVICGKPFEVYPSNAKQECCSSKCGAALRTLHGKRKISGWSKESREAFKHSPAAIAHMTSIVPKMLKVREQMPQYSKGPQNHFSLIWDLIDPDGNHHIVTNLKDWGRTNYKRFYPDRDDAEACAQLIASGFGAIASTLRGKRKIPIKSFKKWRLDGLPIKGGNNG